MTSMFKIMAQDCGLTRAQAADFVNVPLDTAKSWWLGRRSCPEHIIQELVDFAIRQEVAAQEAALVINQSIEEQGLPEKIELGVAVDDHEAITLGWPYADAHAAVVRKLIQLLPKELAVSVKIVPRGSTPATSAAISD